MRKMWAFLAYYAKMTSHTLSEKWGLKNFSGKCVKINFRKSQEFWTHFPFTKKSYQRKKNRGAIPPPPVDRVNTYSGSSSYI